MPYSNIQTISKGRCEKINFYITKTRKSFVEMGKEFNHKKNIYNSSTYALLNRTGSFIKWKDKLKKR